MRVVPVYTQYTRTRRVIYFLTDDGGADLTVHVLRLPPFSCYRTGAGHDWLIKASFTCDTYIIIHTYTYKTIPRSLINHEKEKKKTVFRIISCVIS